jgi:photosystem II stability/assembly factor-like uncharacterized protein
MNIGLDYSDRVNVLTVINESIFAGTNYGGIYYSGNNAKSWIKRNEGLPEYINISGLECIDDHIFATTFKGGIIVSSDNGDNWQASNNDFKRVFPSDIPFMVVSNGVLIVNLSFDLFISRDSAKNWESIYNIYPNSLSSLSASKNVIMFGYGQYIESSTDFGESWTKKVLPFNYYTFIQALYIGDSVCYAGSNSYGIFKSTDFGKSWIGPFIITSFTDTVDLVFTYENKVFAGVRNYGLFVSTDDGNTWSECKNGLTAGNVHSMTLFNKVLYAGTDSGVYQSKDKGKTWVNIGLNDQKINKLKANKYYLFAGTPKDGIFRYKLSERPVSVQKDNEINFSLMIFPNPAKSITEIKYSLPEPFRATLIVTNSLGLQERRILSNEYQSPGEHSLSFDVSGLSSGLYFCTLKAGGFSQTMQIVVVK